VEPPRRPWVAGMHASGGESNLLRGVGRGTLHAWWVRKVNVGGCVGVGGGGKGHSGGAGEVGGGCCKGSRGWLGAGRRGGG
jgi:hypothetical protein